MRWLTAHLPEFSATTRRGLEWLGGVFITRANHVPTGLLSRWLFLRGLGIVYLIAFTSYWVQIDGLIGSQGILPIAPLLDSIRDQLGPERYWLLPSLVWLNPSDAFLHFLCGSGAALSIVLVAGVAPAFVLILLWILYLSLTCAGQTFFNFQWDALLLETGLAAIFYAPWQWLPRPSRERSPPAVSLWLMRWLAFRIMFLSGLVKLTFDDPIWWRWRALDFHYFTQPLPTWTSWYMHALPHWAGVISLAFMWYAELIAPFFIWGPRRIRAIAFWSIVSFQLLILATGNYGFFNLLTIVLCITVVNDSFWPNFLRRRIRFATSLSLGSPWRYARASVTALFATIILLTTLMECIESCNHPIAWPAALSWLREQVSPLRSMNGYGLFRVMTTKRREIVIEGSDDGETWKAYEFKWKPGDPTRRPRFCTPHMPRLDWQMWFAALGDYRQNRWFTNFLSRLLEGSPPVLELMDANPFPNRPPRYIRALLYDYQFTAPHEREQTGRWWRRQLLGLYCPVLARRANQVDREFRLEARPSTFPGISLAIDR